MTSPWFPLLYRSLGRRGLGHGVVTRASSRACVPLLDDLPAESLTTAICSPSRSGSSSSSSLHCSALRLLSPYPTHGASGSSQPQAHNTYTQTRACGLTSTAGQLCRPYPQQHAPHSSQQNPLLYAPFSSHHAASSSSSINSAKKPWWAESPQGAKFFSSKAKRQGKSDSPRESEKIIRPKGRKSAAAGALQGEPGPASRPAEAKEAGESKPPKRKATHKTGDSPMATATPADSSAEGNSNPRPPPPSPAGTGEASGGGGESNLQFLDRLLEEMEGPQGVGTLADSSKEDQFLASLRLRVAQEYAEHGTNPERAERLALQAWEFFGEGDTKDNMAGALALHVLGSCKARSGDFDSASKIIQKALKLAKVCRAATLSRTRKPKQQPPKGQQETQKPAPRKIKHPMPVPLQPEGFGLEGLRDLMLEGERWDQSAWSTFAPGAEGIRGEEARAAATNLEFSCCMMLGEIAHAQGDLEQAVKMFLASVNLASLDEALSSSPASREASFSLSNTLLQLQRFPEALHFATAAGLGTEAVQEGEGAGAAWQEQVSGGGKQGEGGLMGGEGDGPSSEVLALAQLLREKRLLASIRVGLGHVRAAAEALRAVRQILGQLGAPPLELAAADVATAEVLLCGNSEEREGQEEGVEGSGEEVGSKEQEEGAGQDEQKQQQEGEGQLHAPLNDDEIREFQEEALGLLTSAVRVQESELGEHHPALVSTRVSAAEACFQLGRETEAEQFCDSALRLFDSIGADAGTGGSMGGAFHVEHLPELMAQTASVLTNLGRTGLALGLVQRAEEILHTEGRFGDSLGMIMDHTSLLLSLDKAPEALALLSLAEESHKEVLKVGVIKDGMGDFLHLKGCALSENGRNEEAIEALEGASRVFGLFNEKGKMEPSDVEVSTDTMLVKLLIEVGEIGKAVEAQRRVESAVKQLEGAHSELYQREAKKRRDLEAQEREVAKQNFNAKI